MESLATDKVLMGILSISRESQTPKDLVNKCADFLKGTYGVEQAIIKDPQQGKLGSVDEYTLNTTKPFIDSNLSSYSTFAELIEYYNRGFKFCAVLPIVREGRPFGTITLLSKDGTRLQAYQDSFSAIAALVSAEASVKFERDKSLGLAKYFDASFNSTYPQFLVDAVGTVIKANKYSLNSFERSQKDISGANIAEIFEIGKEDVAKLLSGSSIVSYGKAQRNSIFELYPSRINENLMHVLVSEVSGIRNAQVREKLMGNADNEVFMMLDPDRKVTWVSANADKVFRISKDMLIGKSIFDFVADADNVKKSMLSFTGKYVNYLNFDFGNNIRIGARFTCYKDGDSLSCIVAKDYEKYVKELVDDAEELIDLSSDSIIRIDPSGYISTFNRSAERLFKLGKEMKGTQIYSLCADPQSQNRLSNSLIIAKTNGVVGDVFLNMVDYDRSTEIPCQQTIKSLVDDKNSVVGYLVISKELLSKKQFERVQDDLDKALREVDRLSGESSLKSQFIYNISHDLKTPITNIMGFSKLMLTDNFGELTKEQRDYIQIIYDESERFLQLVKQILDVAKLSSGIVKLDYQAVDLKEIAQNPSIKALEEACKNKGLEWKWDIDYTVPPFKADPNRLIQVFSNLISNALKFTEQGGITIRAYKKGKYVRIEVSDTGIGISKEDKTKIFKKFYQLKRGLI
ncbi:MAG: PAS domain-containing protein, partial [Candidatus Micrarchaeota archaeon]|nr:PAS domain-containing protein [Candidatus Micrarchaeota archaeon]